MIFTDIWNLIHELNRYGKFEYGKAVKTFNGIKRIKWKNQTQKLAYNLTFGNY